jgi:serine/threonine protein kinase
MSLQSGTTIGAYEILGPLGAGGMGEVYKARDPRLGRDVAVKVLPAALAADADRQRRFELEARAAARLNHPNILQIYDVGQHDGQPFLVTEFLDGETLRERMGDAPNVAVQAMFGLARIEVAYDVLQGERDLLFRY